MPDTIGDGLIGWLRRGNGLVLLGFAALGWIGLLSWELPAQGQAAAAGSAVSHLLGKLPAATADFLLQSFGIAAAVLFAVPTFWGVEQLARQRLGRPLLRLLLWPASALAAAGSLSALPAPANWPFARGLGGVVGDQLYALLKLAASTAAPSLAGPAAGLLLGLAAIALFVTAIGAAGRASTESEAETVQPAGFREINFGTADDPRPDDQLAGFSETGDGFATQPTSPGELNRFIPNRSVRMAPPRKGRPPAFTRMTDDAQAGNQLAATDPQQPIHVPYDDLPDDDESRRMAKRFAPGGERSDSVDSEPVGEPAPWIGWKQLLGRASDAVAPLASVAAQAARPAAAPYFALAAMDETFTPEQMDDEPATASVRTWPESASAYRVPSTNLLSRQSSTDEATASDNRELVARARRLEDVLADFGVRCEIIAVVPGPIVTQFEIETAPGIKTSRVVALAQDIARALRVDSARIVPAPGRATVVIELPNERRSHVALRELLESKAYRQGLNALPLAVGVAVDQRPIVTDLSMLTGVLIAGNPGAGKSTALNSMISSMLLRFAPTDLRLLIVDPKGVDHTPFDGIAHLVAPVAVDPAQALAALQWCVMEMDERQKAMAKLNLRGIGTYNNAVRNALRQGTGFKRAVQTGFDRTSGRALYEEEIVTPKAMPYIVVVIDDLDVLMQAGAEPIDAALQRLGQGARNAGIHLVAASGRLDGDVLSAGLRAALPARICFKLNNKGESRSAIGDGGAELLLGAGDFLFSVGGAPVRGQAPMLAEGDLGRVAEAVRSQSGPNYEPSITRAMADARPPTDTEIYQQAVSSALQHGSTSVAELRGSLGIGYVAANDLLLRMQTAGLVAGQDDASGRRRVLLGRAASA